MFQYPGLESSSNHKAELSAETMCDSLKINEVVDVGLHY